MSRRGGAFFALVSGLLHFTRASHGAVLKSGASMSDSGTEPKSRPRFVAGAVCPSCGAVDRMVIDVNADHRRCVACEFVEARPDAPAEQPVTRVTRASARRVETPAEA